MLAFISLFAARRKRWQNRVERIASKRFDVGEDVFESKGKAMASFTVSQEQELSTVTGTLFVHSCPQALVPHVEWALAREIGQVVKMQWSPQPLLPKMMRAESTWSGPPETAASVASSLLGWQQLRFEITEDHSGYGSGGRWMHTPSLGISYVQADAAGNLVLTEQQIRTAIELSAGSGASLTKLLASELGEAWDRELEPFRVAEVGDATIFTLHRTG
jgi:hypothetical protein